MSRRSCACRRVTLWPQKNPQRSSSQQRATGCHRMRPRRPRSTSWRRPSGNSDSLFLSCFAGCTRRSRMGCGGPSTAPMASSAALVLPWTRALLSGTERCGAAGPTARTLRGQVGPTAWSLSVVGDAPSGPASIATRRRDESSASTRTSLGRVCVLGRGLVCRTPDAGGVPSGLANGRPAFHAGVEVPGLRDADRFLRVLASLKALVPAVCD